MAGRKAEHNPDGNRLTIQFLFPKSTGGKRKAGEIILINGDVPRITVRAPEAMMLETERREMPEKGPVTVALVHRPGWEREFTPIESPIPSLL